MKKITLWLIKLAVSTGILYCLFLKIPFANVIHALVNTKIVFLFPALLLQIGMIYIRAFQIKIFVLQQKMNFTVSELVKINFITFFYSLFLPGELMGGAVRWYKLSKPEGKRAQALACIIFTRTISIFTLTFVGTIFFFIERPYDHGLINISLFTGLLASSLLFLSITNAAFSLKIENLAQRFGFLTIPKFIREKTAKVWNSIKEFHKAPSNHKIYALSLAVLFHLLQIFSLYFFMRALDINISIISIAWIIAAVFFLQMLPISISGLGVREGALVFLLKKYSVLGPDAMALSLLIFGVSVAFAFLGGILEAMEFFKQKKRALT